MNTTKYVSPEVTVITLDGSDIITTSFGNGDSTVIPMDSWGW